LIDFIPVEKLTVKKRMNHGRLLTYSLAIVFLFCNIKIVAQNKTLSKPNLVYVDKQGVLRYTNGNEEAAFFGVNYTAPFAFSYRAIKTLNVNLEKAIQDDVYHMSRLGFDAFRVHVWDTEITDTLGNLLQNEHLRLFDFLLAELKKRNIKTIITPIAFWGNGYPERDEITPGFSHKYGKRKALSNDTAFKAQENYLKQFFKHVNPYTKQTYTNDQDIIAVEINNEPQHTGTIAYVTNYVNRMVTAVKSVGWTKPVYYNISESPLYAEAVSKANVDGVSFQWYPTGLVANNMAKGNYLPNVDKYTIPFDSIPAYKNKSLMVYEFDAADVLQSNMYPAMAKSFRQAGFQWATQFAYDPMAIAQLNTEYQTHYLNLAYTPSKAISMLIAGKAFHKLSRKKSYGNYPADSIFDVFRLSYREALSEMKTSKEFYYSNSTSTLVDDKFIEHIAGVGSSSVIQYDGSGAYFLDKIEEGIWRLEVMPDALFIKDPFEKAAPSKEVTRIQWQVNNMDINLNNLGTGFSIRGLNQGNNFLSVADNKLVQIKPGTYLLISKGKNFSIANKMMGAIALTEFVAPAAGRNDIFVRHHPLEEVTAGIDYAVSVLIAGLDSGKVSLQLTSSGQTGWGKIISMDKKAGADYIGVIPKEMMVPGLLSYRVIVQRDNEYVLFPGNIKGDPYAWDAYQYETFKTFVAHGNSKLEVYNPTSDQKISIYPSYQKGFQTTYTTGEDPKQLLLQLSRTEPAAEPLAGFQHFIGDKLNGRLGELPAFDKLIIRAGTTNRQAVKLKILLTNADAQSFSGELTVSGALRDFELLLNDLRPDSSLLLPRPYPGFLPLYFKAASGNERFVLQGTERIQVITGHDSIPEGSFNPLHVTIASIWLKKKE
jgi:Cellulase (glycosyl hydrolase family 5)